MHFLLFIPYWLKCPLPRLYEKLIQQPVQRLEDGIEAATAFNCGRKRCAGCMIRRGATGGKPR